MSCPMKNNSNSVRPLESLMSKSENEEALKKLEADPGMLYSDYLLLDRLLSSQEPVTRTKFTRHRHTEVHDEHLFIITHQTYELWFKQIIFELDSVRQLLNNEQVDEANMLRISSRLDRIKKIFGILVEQFSILETMTPLDFMDFRNYLSPASGFQSVQFRLIENKLGIRNESRTNYKPNEADQDYVTVFKDPKSIEEIKNSEQEPSLFSLIEKWLMRTPGLERDGFDFCRKYKEAVEAWLKEDQDKISEYSRRLEELMKSGELSKEVFARDKQSLANMTTALEKKRLVYLSIMDEKAYKQFRFQYRAMCGALMISLYRDEPRFNQPYQLLVTLMDIDSLLTKWRQNHTQMVLRMIGSDTMGTGGSSGYQYLKTTLADRYNVFLDLFKLSTYLLPKDRIPELTPTMRKRLTTMD